MEILHLACLNNDPEIQPNMGPKCNPVGGEPHNLLEKVNLVFKYIIPDKILYLNTF